MRLSPVVESDNEKLYYSFVTSKASTKLPTENVEAHVIQSVHALAILQALELLKFATTLQPDTKIPIRNINGETVREKDADQQISKPASSDS